MKKSEREHVRLMFGGRCAYCGSLLGDRWHADHVQAVVREMRYVSGKGFVRTGRLERPENERIENIVPACPPCNIDKHSMPIEAWREKLSRTCNVLQRNNPTYRHGLRFGLISELSGPVVFYFEKVSATTPDAGALRELVQRWRTEANKRYGSDYELDTRFIYKYCSDELESLLTQVQK